MKTIKLNPYLLPIIVFHFVYIIGVIKAYAVEFTYISDAALGFKGYLLATILCCPHILISYIYLPISIGSIQRFKVITFAMLLVYILLYTTIEPLGLLYLYLKSGITYWIALVLLYTNYFIKWNNIKILRWSLLCSSTALLAFACFIVIYYKSGQEYSFWLFVVNAYVAVNVFITYFLYQLKDEPIFFTLGLTMIISSSVIIEFFTPLNYIIVALVTIVFFMLLMQWIINKSKYLMENTEDMLK